MSMQVYVADTHTTCETIIERAVLGQASFGHLHSSDGVSVPLSNQFILPNSFVAGWPIAGSVTNVSVSVYLCDSRVRWFSHPLGFSRTNTPMETANRNSSSNRSRYIRSTQRGKKKNAESEEGMKVIGQSGVGKIGFPDVYTKSAFEIPPDAKLLDANSRCCYCQAMAIAYTKILADFHLIRLNFKEESYQLSQTHFSYVYTIYASPLSLG